MHSEGKIKNFHDKIPHCKKNEVVFLGQTIAPNGVSPQKKKLRKFQRKANFLAPEKQYEERFCKLQTPTSRETILLLATP